MPDFIEGKTAAASTNMGQKQSMEAFVWGLKKAASRARELAAVQENKAWLDVAKFLDAMRETGETLAKSRPISQSTAEYQTDVIKKRMIVN